MLQRHYSPATKMLLSSCTELVATSSRLRSGMVVAVGTVQSVCSGFFHELTCFLSPSLCLPDLPWKTLPLLEALVCFFSSVGIFWWLNFPYCLFEAVFTSLLFLKDGCISIEFQVDSLECLPRFLRTLAILPYCLMDTAVATEMPVTN